MVIEVELFLVARLLLFFPFFNLLLFKENRLGYFTKQVRSLQRRHSSKVLLNLRDRLAHDYLRLGKVAAIRGSTEHRPPFIIQVLFCLLPIPL